MTSEDIKIVAETLMPQFKWHINIGNGKVYNLEEDGGSIVYFNPQRHLHHWKRLAEYCHARDFYPQSVWHLFGFGLQAQTRPKLHSSNNFMEFQEIDGFAYFYGSGNLISGFTDWECMMSAVLFFIKCDIS